MNVFFIAAGVFALLITPLHLLGGESTLRRVPASAFPTTAQGDGAIMRQEVRFCWHMVTVDLALAGVLLLLIAFTNIFSDPVLVARLIAVYFAAYGVVILVLPLLTLRRWDTLYRLPQWLMCWAVSGLALLGTLA